MSEADILFKNLGYQKENFDDCVIYTKNESGMKLRICFYIFHNLINIKRFRKLEDGTEDAYSYFLNMNELKAINLKCKELGMIDNE